MLILFLQKLPEIRMMEIEKGSRINKAQFLKDNNYHKLRKLKNKTLNIFARFMLIPSVRVMFYRLMGIKVGEKVFIGPDCYLDDEVPVLITIEDEVTVAFRVIIVAHDDTGEKTVAPIILRKGCYIGTGAIVLSGVEIGEKAIVGAGAVVTRSVPPGITVTGIPAKPIMKKSE